LTPTSLRELHRSLNVRRDVFERLVSEVWFLPLIDDLLARFVQRSEGATNSPVTASV
jgi:hypothetical protein